MTRLRTHTPRLLLLSVGLLFSGCAEESASIDKAKAPDTTKSATAADKDRQIVSNTRLFGSVNDSEVVGEISAVIHTGRGGSSTCTFSSLPKGFNPGTFGTHT